MSEPDCFVCQKLRGDIQIPEEVIYQDEMVYACHAFNPESTSLPYLGHLIVQPKRHVPGLAELTDDEAQQLSLLITRLSRALKASENAEHVYLFVLGHHVAHLHYHVVPRYPGTPREYWGLHMDEWPQAPKGDTQAIADLGARIRAHLEARHHE
jgi:diadenosine tetraphosphate (Ap4A) HIT family hydrolase